MLPINHPANLTIDNRIDDRTPAPRYLVALHKRETRATGIKHHVVIPLYAAADLAPLRARLRRLLCYAEPRVIAAADLVRRIPNTARVLFADRKASRVPAGSRG